jgi:hypothetical protein
VPTHQDYFIELVAPRIILPETKKSASGKRKE